ncbi:MAG: hypothetical protein J1E62_07125 [Lachnospiraceae bacterium]|nr:hypothetical protein [Lachnospiraceae bacterium]
MALSLGLHLDKTTVVFSGNESQKVQVPDLYQFGCVGCIDMRQSSEVDFCGATISAEQIIGFSHIKPEEQLRLKGYGKYLRNGNLAL